MKILRGFFRHKDKMGQEQKSEKIEKVQEKEGLAVRKGELGEYKIDIQLDQLPKEYLHLSDLMLKNEKSKTGYSQIDHIILTPYCIFVIETKNYQGTIYGGKNTGYWLVNGKFKMLNPLKQNFGHIQALSKYVDNKDYPLFVNMVSFTKRCTVKVEPELRKISSQELIVYDVELTEFINRKVAVTKLQNKQPLLDTNEMETIFSAIQAANITDIKSRDAHIGAIKEVIEKKPASHSRCVVCNSVVSEKVKKYCESQKIIFNGKIYCFEHQKEI
ncbi:nuclease-related domain-containing protein [Neobacillus terrae]|uniref:nuclease-related domain-containing protein n=1 Tax=Neobacillus terrae TaxID=3034837 RepID=UPI00140C124D|nr:nuclease-related domain-containing protein [Neobacillus terrae]NHM32067.1 NERD domain-containing protein [Neobacillus terrae]